MPCSKCNNQIFTGYEYCTSCGEHYHRLETQAKKVTDPRELGVSVVSPLRSPHLFSATSKSTAASSGASNVVTASEAGKGTDKSQNGSVTTTGAASSSATVVGASKSAAGSAKKTSTSTSK